MNVLNNYLTSGHDFTTSEKLKEFRFSFLNALMLFALIGVVINLKLGSNVSSTFKVALIIYCIVSLLVILSLRYNKKYFFLAVSFFILSSLVLFYFVLLTHPEDELRLIAFFLASFIAYVLLGKKYGLVLSLSILMSIFLIINSTDLQLSSTALATFFSFFSIFTASLYAFIYKIEKDEIEFGKLNERLAENILEEKHQREEQEQMLLRQYRMAHMGEMLDAIAHQWRQPLMHINSIIMNIDYALEKKANKDTYLEEKVSEVALLTTHMSQTINDFRNLFNQENEQNEFKLADVFSNVLELMKNRFLDIEIDNLSSQKVTIYGYQSELTQVIIILLSNAIEVLNSREILSKKITIDAEVKNKKIIITIEDNGGGIKRDNINTIFSPYVTSKKQDGGTGLGLYIAKIIIENKMKGELSAINTQHGAKFTIVLGSIS